MSDPIQSLLATGTKLWLDSIDPELIATIALGGNRRHQQPHHHCQSDHDRPLRLAARRLVRQGLDDDEIAWRLTDELVRGAQQVFLPSWQETEGNDGYVSFELDPLLEDPES